MVRSARWKSKRACDSLKLVPMNKFSHRLVFALCFGVVCTVLASLVMMLGPTAVGKFLGYVHIVPLRACILLSKTTSFGGLGSYCLFISVQWFVVGLAVSFFFPSKQN